MVDGVLTMKGLLTSVLALRLLVGCIMGALLRLNICIGFCSLTAIA